MERARCRSGPSSGARRGDDDLPALASLGCAVRAVPKAGSGARSGVAPGGSLYRGWYRSRLAWIFNDRIFPTLHKDPEWEHPDRSLNAHNDAQGQIFVDYIESELGDRQDVLEQVVPTYPPFGKRMLLDNGWYRMLRNPKVSLVSERIAHVETDRIVTAEGLSYEANALVLATGFDVQRLLTGFDAPGRGGRSLRESFNDTDPRAYRAGLTVPDFPNFFILYGPNSQAGPVAALS